MRRGKKLLACVAVSLSMVLSATTAFAAGSIGGVVDASTVESGETADGEALPEGSHLVLSTDFHDEVDAATLTVIEDVNKGKNLDAIKQEGLDLNGYKMLTDVFDASVVNAQDVVVDGVKNVKITLDLVADVPANTDVFVLHFSSADKKWELVPATVDGKKVTATLKSLSPIAVVYKAAADKDDNGAAGSGDVNPILPIAVTVCLASGAVLVMNRKRA